MKKLLFILVILLICNGQSRLTDSLALVQLYNDHPGNTLTWNFAQPINTYSGVTLNENGRTVGLTLISRVLTDTLSAAIGSLDQLTFIHLLYNGISHLPPEIDQLTNLETLSIRNNALVNLPVEIGDLANLELLLLNNNQLTSIPASIGNLDSLLELQLNNNQLTTLPAEIGNLASLEELYADDNQLGNLPAEIGSLANLQEIDLSNNQLINLPAEIGNLANLEVLDLADNQLTNLPAEIGNLANLEYLYLSYNQLINLPAEIENFANLEVLDLAENQLTNLPAEIGGLINLNELNLNENQLGVIPAEIGNLANLEYLYLSDNQLTNLPAGIGSLSNLKQLYLNNNQLTNLPVEIGNLASLNQFQLSNNQLSSLPGEIGNLSNLRELSLDNNQLTAIPAELGNLSNLRSLWLHRNQIENVPSELGNLSQLTGLYLNDNLIGDLNFTFGNLSKLLTLSLSNNRLSGLPADLSSLTSLRNLYLSSNNLTELPNGLDTLGLFVLRVDSNHLTFSDIEPLILNLTSSITYAPQAKFGTGYTQYGVNGSTIEISINAGGTASHYQWYKDGSSLSGDTLATLELNSIANADNGIYHCLVTNSIATQLTLTSEPITLQIVAGEAEIDSLHLLNLYANNNGPNWGVNWSTAALADWTGVKVESNKVTKLDLSGITLNSEFPVEIAQLANLDSLILSNTELNGNLPYELSLLNQLSYLDLSGNRITSAHDSIVALKELMELDLSDNQLSNLPDLSTMAALTHLNIANNKFRFSGLFGLGLDESKLTYSPQDSIGVSTSIQLFEEDELELTAENVGSGIAYSWFKNGTTIFAAIQATFNIASVSPSDAGSYSYQASLPDFPDLTLYSRSITVVVEIEPPAKPLGLQASAETSGDIKLIWNPNPSTEINFSKYYIYSGTTSNPTTVVDSVEDRTITEKIISNLDNETNYFFRLTAVDIFGNESDYSDQVSATTIKLLEMQAYLSQNQVLTDYITITLSANTEIDQIDSASMAVSNSVQSLTFTNSSGYYQTNYKLTGSGQYDLFVNGSASNNSSYQLSKSYQVTILTNKSNQIVESLDKKSRIIAENVSKSIIIASQNGTNHNNIEYSYQFKNISKKLPLTIDMPLQTSDEAGKYFIYYKSDSEDFQQLATQVFNRNGKLWAETQINKSGTYKLGYDAEFSGTNLVPNQFALSQNYPNPFNPSTTISYDLAENSSVQLIIYNILGQRIRTLVNRTQLAGTQKQIWDGKDDAGKQVASGIYIYSLRAGSSQFAKRMLLIK